MLRLAAFELLPTIIRVEGGHAIVAGMAADCRRRVFPRYLAKFGAEVAFHARVNSGTMMMGVGLSEQNVNRLPAPVAP
jgi:hypothetical protein